MGIVRSFDKACVLPCSRSLYRWPVIILSSLSLIMTLWGIIMCLQFQKSRFYNLPGKLYDFSTTLVIWIITTSILSLLSVVLGIASGFLKNRCVVITFGVLFLPVWIVFLFQAMTIGEFIGSAEENGIGLASFCDDATTPEEGSFMENMKQYKDDLAILYNASDKWMCSYQCPCMEDDANLYVNNNEEELNTWGRTRPEVATAGMIPLNHPVATLDDDVDYFPNTFFDCYFEWKADWVADSEMTPGATPGAGVGTSEWQVDAQSDFEALAEVEKAFDLAEYLELNFQCAGACKTRLFWFALPMETRPVSECSGQVSQQIIEDGEPIAWVLMLASLVFLFTWCCQYGLWFKFKEGN